GRATWRRRAPPIRPSPRWRFPRTATRANTSAASGRVWSRASACAAVAAARGGGGAALRPADIEPIKQYGIERALGMIRATLERFEVDFEVWQSERALHDAGDVGETLRALDGKGYIDRRDDAVWLKTTALWGDDKDRVVVKSDKQPTYLLADIAYHRKKIARGFDELCDIW